MCRPCPKKKVSWSRVLVLVFNRPNFFPPCLVKLMKMYICDEFQGRNIGPPYIPPIEFGRKRELTDTLKVRLNDILIIFLREVQWPYDHRNVRDEPSTTTRKFFVVDNKAVFFWKGRLLQLYICRKLSVRLCGNRCFGCRKLAKYKRHLNMRDVFWACTVIVISQAPAGLT